MKAVVSSPASNIVMRLDMIVASENGSPCSSTATAIDSRKFAGRLAWSSQLWFPRPDRLLLTPGDSPGISPRLVTAVIARAWRRRRWIIRTAIVVAALVYLVM